MSNNITTMYTSTLTGAGAGTYNIAPIAYGYCTYPAGLTSSYNCASAVYSGTSNDTVVITFTHPPPNGIIIALATVNGGFNSGSLIPTVINYSQTLTSVTFVTYVGTSDTAAQVPFNFVVYGN